MTCPNCSTLMQPEHAHYRCATCGYRDSCCF
jgi:DNA-directed RNA polymerase subunit M/transcription elongation factor TFIIS